MSRVLMSTCNKQGAKGGHENITKLLTNGLFVHNSEIFTCPPHVPPVI